MTPKRSAGDKLITYDLSQGGTNPTISFRTWSGTAWGPTTVISGGTSPDALGSINTSLIAANQTGGATGRLTMSLGTHNCADTSDGEQIRATRHCADGLR